MGSAAKQLTFGVVVLGAALIASAVLALEFGASSFSLLRWLGGIPLDRDRTRDFVSQMVDEFNERDQFLLAIMPEGTRGKDRDSSTKGWRSGFYYIARGAGVPLVMVLFDYANKWMRVGPTYWPGESYEVDLPQIQALFAGVEGRNPERMMALGQGAAGGG